MRTRLLVTVLTLVGLVAVGLGALLAVTYARSLQQEWYTDRAADTAYLASLAEGPLTEGEPELLRPSLRRYHHVQGASVAVYGFPSSDEPEPVLTEPATRLTFGPADAVRVDRAVKGVRPDAPGTIWPWDDRPLVVAELVQSGSELRGAVVTVTPLDDLHRDQLRAWALIGLAVVLALALGVLVALPVVRWILRPVRRLDEGTGRVAAAVLAGGRADPVSDGSGPPELRRLTVSFDRMADTVTQALSAQRAFVADASHQLRNPLTALHLRLANLHGHVDAAAAEHHVAALEESERLAVLLDGLLALARAERAAPPVLVDVDAAVDDRLDAWRPLAEHTGLRLERDGDRGLTATAPAGAVETVLDAVLDNAVKFTPAGGSISVATAAHDGEIELAVRDTGPGLAPEELERAADRFWRSPAQTNVEGSGLGLAIAARTAELAGGALRLERPPEGGLLVVARLPRAGGPGSSGDGGG